MEYRKFSFSKEPTIIAGPCSAESEEQILATAEALSKQGIEIFRAGVWKPRTQPGLFEGVGKAAFAWLDKVKKMYGMKTAVEVGTLAQAAEALEAKTDILWIGARTVSDPFAVQDLADFFSKVEDKSSFWVLVKNPIAPDLKLWIGALERISNAGIKNLGAIHRGFCTESASIFRNDPVWKIPIQLKEKFPGLSVICDPSHITGNRALIQAVSQQAFNLGFDGLMIESHIDPSKAWTDAAQQISPEVLEVILNSLVVRSSKFDTAENIKVLRGKLDILDDDLMILLKKRFDICKEIGIHKKENNIPIVQSARFNEIIKNRVEQGKKLGIGEDFVKDLFANLQYEAIEEQMKC